jgi:PPOX class probable F420-dependent enzyme
MSDDNGLRELIARSNKGVLVTLKSDGRPQLSNVSHTFDPATGLIRVSVTADRAKTRNLARDARASYHVTSDDFWHWVVADGTASLTPVAADPHDDTVEELIEVYRAIGGEHSNWDEYRAAMVTDRRLVMRLAVEHLYGQP